MEVGSDNESDGTQTQDAVSKHPKSMAHFMSEYKRNPPIVPDVQPVVENLEDKDPPPDPIRSMVDSLTLSHLVSVDKVRKNALNALLEPHVILAATLLKRKRSLIVQPITSKNNTKVSSQVSRHYSNHTFMVSKPATQTTKTQRRDGSFTITRKGQMVTEYVSIGELQNNAVQRFTGTKRATRALARVRHNTNVLRHASAMWQSQPIFPGGGGRVNISGPRVSRKIAVAAAAESILGISFADPDGRHAESDRARHYYSALAAAFGAVESTFQLAMTLLPHSAFRAHTTVDPLVAEASGSFLVDSAYFGPIYSRKKKLSTEDIDIFCAKIASTHGVERSIILDTSVYRDTGQSVKESLASLIPTPALRYLKSCYGLPIVPFIELNGMAFYVETATVFTAFTTGDNTVTLPYLYADNTCITAHVENSPHMTVTVRVGSLQTQGVRHIEVIFRSLQWNRQLAELLLVNVIAHLVQASQWHTWRNTNPAGSPIYEVVMSRNDTVGVFRRFADIFFGVTRTQTTSEGREFIGTGGMPVEMNDPSAINNCTWLRSDRDMTPAVACSVEGSRVYTPSGAMIADVGNLNTIQRVQKFDLKFQFVSDVDDIFATLYASFIKDLFTTSSYSYEVMYARVLELPVSLSSACVICALAYNLKRSQYVQLRGWASYIIDEHWVTVLNDENATEEARKDALFAQAYNVPLRIVLLPFYVPSSTVFISVPCDVKAILGITFAPTGFPRLYYDDLSLDLTYAFRQGTVQLNTPNLTGQDQRDVPLDYAATDFVLSVRARNSDLVLGLLRRGLLTKCNGPATETDLTRLLPGVYDIGGEFFSLADTRTMDNSYTSQIQLLQIRMGMTQQEAESAYQEYMDARMEAYISGQRPIEFMSYFEQL